MSSYNGYFPVSVSFGIKGLKYTAYSAPMIHHTNVLFPAHFGNTYLSMRMLLPTPSKLYRLDVCSKRCPIAVGRNMLDLVSNAGPLTVDWRTPDLIRR